MRSTLTVLSLVLATVSSACSPPAREYDLKGQILAVNAEEHTLTIRHDDIEGFMPAMTMPFKVRDRELLEGRVPGDLVRATLVVRETDAYLSAVERVGHVELTEAEPPPGAALPIAMAGDEAPMPSSSMSPAAHDGFRTGAGRW
jgi:protein SCO1